MGGPSACCCKTSRTTSSNDWSSRRSARVNLGAVLLAIGHEQRWCVEPSVPVSAPLLSVVSSSEDRSIDLDPSGGRASSSMVWCSSQKRCRWPRWSVLTSGAASHSGTKSVATRRWRG